MSEDVSDSTHPCPTCGERIKQVARKCRHCGEFLDPALKTKRRKQRLKALAGSQGPTQLRRVWRSLCAVIFPILAFVFSEIGFTRELLPEWNDGSLLVWGKLLYAPELHRGSYPLLVWAMASYSAHASGYRNRWIEAGLLGGVILSVAYGLLFLPMIPLSFFAIMMYGVGLLGFMPYVACVVYTAAYVRYRREGRTASPDTMAFPWLPRALWVAIGLGASSVAYKTLLGLHAALSTSPPPNCYLATLAARGDSRVVRAVPVRFADGQLHPVSRQLRVFKVAELTLVAIAPALHAPLRWLYDRSGQPLAARMSRRQATAIYLLLVPVQLFAELCLWALFRGSRAMVDSTYPRQ